MIDLTQPCIIAPGKPNKNGYHRVEVYNKRWYAHRYAYFMTYGPPPPEKPFILHKCNNKSCWNPGHLEAGTNSDNQQDSIKAGTFRFIPADRNRDKTHCPQGHELSGSNLTKTELRRGWRKCRVCHNNNRRVNNR